MRRRGGTGSVGAGPASAGLKPLARARRPACVTTRVHEALGRELEERLFDEVEVLAEGHLDAATGVYAGSAMLTVDLEAAAGRPLPPATVERVVRAIAGSVRVRVRASRLARDEVRRRLGAAALGTARTETAFRVRGATLEIDVDVEVPATVAGTG